MRGGVLMSVLWVCGCTDGGTDTDVFTGISETDRDDDGFTAQYDCNDDDASIYPGATELCDGFDNDCDDLVDEDGPGATTWYRDQDGDGHGDYSAEPVTSCEPPGDDGYAPAGSAANYAGDCDDQDASVNPDEKERCGDGLDNDCDGSTDEFVEGEDDEESVLGLGTWYLDVDGDGFGLRDEAMLGCVRPDYDPDGTGASYDGAWEGTLRFEVEESSAAGDTGVSVDTGASGAGLSCSCDGAAVRLFVRGGAVDYAVAESCALDCGSTASLALAGTVSEAGMASGTLSVDQPVPFVATWTADLSAADPTGEITLDAGDLQVLGSLSLVASETEFASQPDDCDDTDAKTFPGAGFREESTASDGSELLLCMRDRDGDGYGDRNAVSPIEAGTDCEDEHAQAYPSLRMDIEICDGLDNNCDGDLGDLEGDRDGDGFVGCVVDDDAWYGDAISSGVDCDPDDPMQYPGAPESCNDADDDCDGVSDEAGAVDEELWYPDADGDGFGDATATESTPVGSERVSSCEQPQVGSVAYVGNGDDCDDTNAAISPAASEVCDEQDVDEDCDGASDDADSTVDSSGQSTFYLDADGDGHGDPGNTADLCDAPSSYVDNADDCYDSSANASDYLDDSGTPLSPEQVFPGQSESCNAADDDCDGLVDDADPDSTVLGSDWYADVDGDGYGREAVSTNACAQPTGYVAMPSGDENADGIVDFDCDDGDSDVNPGASEVCRDGADNDCNGSQDQCDLRTTGRLEDVAYRLEGTATRPIGEAGTGMADLDGDGSRDLVVGLPRYEADPSAPTHQGGLGILYGPLTIGGAIPTSSSLQGVATGDTDGYRAGSVVLSMTTLSGSAQPDIIVGSCPDASTAIDTMGEVHFFFDATASALSQGLGDADLTFEGENATDLFGCSGAVAGDQNDDAIVDLIVGAPGYDSDKGGFYVVYGSLSGNSVLSSSASLVEGETAGDAAAEVMSANEDVNGDGEMDVLVSASAASSGRGRGYLVLGPISADTTLSASGIAFIGEAVDDAAGSGVALAELNGDGYADVIIGAPGNDEGDVDAGSVYVMYGPLTSDKALSNADAQLTGEVASAAFGTSVVNAGDLNNDGFDDIAIGAPTTAPSSGATGTVYLHYWSSELGSLSGTQVVTDADVGYYQGPSVGSFLVSGGDLDDDGWDDLVVGAAYDTSNGAAGALYLLSGNGY